MERPVASSRSHSRVLPSDCTRDLVSAGLPHTSDFQRVYVNFARVSTYAPGFTRIESIVTKSVVYPRSSKQAAYSSVSEPALPQYSI